MGKFLKIKALPVCIVLRNEARARIEGAEAPQLKTFFSASVAAVSKEKKLDTSNGAL